MLFPKWTEDIKFLCTYNPQHTMIIDLEISRVSDWKTNFEVYRMGWNSLSYFCLLLINIHVPSRTQFSLVEYSHLVPLPGTLLAQRLKAVNTNCQIEITEFYWQSLNFQEETGKLMRSPPVSFSELCLREIC